MAQPNILVVGLVSLANEADVNTEALTRDHSRIQELKKTFDIVFSLAKDTGGQQADVQHHVSNRIGKDGALALVALMNKYHREKLIHHVCIEYVRLPAMYYRPFIIGGGTTIEAKAGNVLTEFMRILNENKKLAGGCVLQFARHPSDSRWLSAITNYETAFGTTIEYVAADENPLYVAGERTQAYLNEILERPYNHREELRERVGTQNYTNPFVQFIFPPRRLCTNPSVLPQLRQPFVPPRPVIDPAPEPAPEPDTPATPANEPDAPVTPANEPDAPVTPATPATPANDFNVPILHPTIQSIFDVPNFDFDTPSEPSADPDPDPMVSQSDVSPSTIIRNNLQEARAEQESDMGAMIDEFRELMTMSDGSDNDEDGVRQRDVHTDSERSWSMTENEIVEQVVQEEQRADCDVSDRDRNITYIQQRCNTIGNRSVFMVWIHWSHPKKQSKMSYAP